jgi:hypothetical protein
MTDPQVKYSTSLPLSNLTSSLRPFAATTIDAPLTARQLSYYCPFLLGYAPTHPEFNDCSRRLATGIVSQATA